jgi:hypothetical protein
MGWREFLGVDPPRRPVVQKLPLTAPRTPKSTLRAFLGGIFSRTMAWVVGGIFGVVGVVTAIRDAMHHHHGLAPWLITISFLFLFIASIDMWRKERALAQSTAGRVTDLEQSVEKLEDDLRDSRRRADDLHVELAKAQNYVLNVQAGTTPDNTIVTGDPLTTD